MITLLKIIQKSLGKLDYVLLIAALILFTHFDYSNLVTSDIIYIVTFALWFVMLLVRIFIVFKNEVKQ